VLKAILKRIFRLSRNQDRSEDAPFRDFVESAIDRSSYLDAYPDVRAAGIDPAIHWLEYGLYEGRRLAPGLVVQRGVAARYILRPDVRRFVWRGDAITISGPLPTRLTRQIMAQARHEPAILAPGVRAIPHLRWHEADDLAVRDGIDVRALFDAVPEQPRTILVIPMLRAGHAAKYGADLIDILVAAGGGPGLILATDQTAMQADGWRDLTSLAPFRAMPILYWRDICNGAICNDPRILANFLNGLRPATVLVMNSQIGLEAIARYGRGLSQQAFLCCTYSEFVANSPEARLSARFPRLTIPHALTLTDNMAMAESLKTLYGGLEGPGIAVLPARVEPVSDVTFDMRVTARFNVAKAGAGGYLWACVCHDGRSENIATLNILAGLRVRDRFEVFGPPPGQALPNVIFRGALENLEPADFSTHDGFIFIGSFEGIPDIILTMSQRAVPMVLPDAGALRDTFDDSAVTFVSPMDTPVKSAAAFAQALEDARQRDAGQAIAMARAARTLVMARHSPIRHERIAAALFGLS
jgi:hypothetical protein